MSWTKTSALALSLALLLSAVAAGRVIAPDPLPRRVALADAVVVGKVTKFEDKTVKINEVEYQVAVVKVEQGLRGAEGLTHVRVAVMPGRGRGTLAQDQEAL